MGPLIGGALVDLSGWQGLFWLDAAIAAVCIPLTLAKVQESRDPQRARSIDYAGTVLIAVALVPLVLGFSKGGDWGWTSAATLGCFVASAVGAVLFVVVEKRVSAPIVDLALLRNQVLVGTTLAILIVAGMLNGLMYVLSLYLQNPATFGMSALETGVATLPAAAAMIAVTPLITPIAARIGTRLAIVVGFGFGALGFGALALVESSWTYAALVLPLVVLSAGLGLANGPASSASTAAVSQDQVGQASGISNMARYIGGSVVVALVATIFNSATVEETAAGASAGGRACDRPLARRAADGDPVRPGHRARAADGTSSAGAPECGRPRRCGGWSHRAYDPDATYARPGLTSPLPTPLRSPQPVS